MTKKLSMARRRHLIDADPDALIRIFSLQDLGAWEAAQERGYWTVEEGFYEANHVPDQWEPEHSYLPHYRYMREEMAARLPEVSGDFPVWAWLIRPNMRQWSFQREPTVMLVADVPRRRMLISDFDLWHMPLNYGPCTNSEAEDDAFEAAHPRTTCRNIITPELRETWAMVFDLEPVTDPVALAWRGRNDRFQACIDRIYLDEVVSVKPCHGRLGRRGSVYHR